MIKPMRTFSTISAIFILLLLLLPACSPPAITVTQTSPLDSVGSPDEITPHTTIITTTAPVDIVYITRTGERYHRGSCRYLSQSKIPIERQEAIARGYTPCKVCRP